MTAHKKMLLTAIILASLAGVALLGTSVALTPTVIGPADAPMSDEAVVQVYGADVWGMRGYFAIHTWVATKAKNADKYTIYQVIGWRLRRNGTALSVTEGIPNKPWFRSPPLLLHEVKGVAAEALVERVHDAAMAYPYDKEYVMWPGPNSNSFTAWIALEVPELGLELPLKAIGKQWMHNEYASRLSPRIKQAR